MKKFFTLLLGLMLATQVWAKADFIVDRIYYNITSNTAPFTVEVAQPDGYNEYEFTHVDIPESVTYNGRTYIVTGIGKVAFTPNHDNREATIESVTLPSTITSIGDGAFYRCKKLTSITIPNGVVYIGESAFMYCPLASINIPSTVTTIKGWAFYGCKFTSVNIPPSVTEIGERAFAYNAFETIAIPNSVTSMAKDAFYAAAVTTVYLEAPSVPTTWNSEWQYDGIKNVVCGMKVLRPMANNPSYGTVTSSSTTSDVYVCNDGSIWFKNSANITLNAVPTEGCEFVSWSDGNTSAQRTLTNISSSQTITAEFKFNYFIKGNLKYVITDASAQTVSVAQSSEKPSGKLVIPSDVTFGGVWYSVTSIASSGFKECADITSVTLPNSIKSISRMAFYKCTGLTDAPITSNITQIDQAAFLGCTGITSVSLPSSITSMSTMVFNSCTNLKEVTVNTTAIGNLFSGLNITSVTIGNDMTSIPKTAFSNCSKLTTVSFSESVKEIGEEAFSNCSELSSVTIPNTVTSIGKKAFSRTKIVSLEIPGSVKSIGYEAFSYCSELESVTMNKGVEKIVDFAFVFCPKLRNVIFPQSITSIGKCAFSGYRTLKNIEIPASVTSIGEKAFESAIHITYNGTVEDGAPWGAYNMNGFIDNDYIYTDENKTNLIVCLGDVTTVLIPESVTTIGSMAFWSCSKLKRIYIPKSVTTIGENVFYDDSEDLTIYCEYAEEDIPTGWKANWNGDNYTVYWDQVLIKYAPTDDIKGYVATSATTLVSGIDVCAKNSKISLNAEPSKNYFFSSWNDGSTINLRSITVTESKEYIATFKPLVFEYNNLQYTVTDVEKHEVSVAMKKKPSGNFEIPSKVYDKDNDEYTVTTIENSAFNECTELTSVVIPNTVTSIGEKAFFKCSNLTSITLPEGLTTIQNRAFAQCTSLTLTLPHTVTEIGQGAFEMACTNQKELVIPQSVTDIGRNAFSTFGNNPDFFCEVSEQPSSWNTTWHTGFMGEVNGTAYFNCKQVTFGALTFITSGISYEEPKVIAKIQGDFESTDELPLQITELQATKTVKVTLYRTFTAGVSSTIMLPFEFSLDESFGKFYTVESVAPDDNGVWTATMSLPITGNLQPNTPYVFKPAKDITELTFENVSLNPTSPGTNGTGDWKLHGVYEKTTLYGKGKINYGFAGIDAEGIQKGEFIRAGEGVWADPMRCYLTYKDGKEITKAATVLPDCIRVVFPDEVEESNNGEIITPISEINNEIGVNVWSYNRTIYIESQPDTNYTIVDLNGRTLKTGVTHSTREEITLGRSTGIVIVNINGKSFKINY